MFSLMGTETEYGLSVEGKGPEHLAGETAALLRALPVSTNAPWDYSRESPLQDLRGFRARALAFDPRDAKFDRQGEPPAHAAAVRVDRLLGNGARLYNDHGHPEYSTPECSRLADLVAHDRAGERILLQYAAALERAGGAKVRLYKNNTDFHGFSYGCHENYLLPRPEEPEAFLQQLAPFLVTRQIFAGAGKVGLEGERKDQQDSGLFFQLSQRADYFSRLLGTDTLYRRPLINTRDEPHADASRYIRLHMVLGDANRSQFALALKLGTTALALRLISDGWRPPWALADPVQAVKQISRDQERGWVTPLSDGRQMSAIEIQAYYLNAAQSSFGGADDEVDWLLANWRETLEELAADPLRLADRLDWPAKLMLLRTYLQEVGREEQGLLQSLDLEYHNLDPQESLFAPLEESGRMRRVVSEEAIRAAMEAAPNNTRARIRGEAIRRFGPQLSAVSWSRLCGDGIELELGKMVDGSLEELNRQLEAAGDFGSFSEIVRRWEHEHAQ